MLPSTQARPRRVRWVHVQPSSRVPTPQPLKSTIAVLAFAAILVPIASLLHEWRFANGRHEILAYTVFGVGALISVVNCYLSVLHRLVLSMLGRGPDNLRVPSGIPMLGMLVLPGLLLAPVSFGLSVACFSCLLIDTGNLPWFVWQMWSDKTLWGSAR